jgi:hypothetical protein
MGLISWFSLFPVVDILDRLYLIYYGYYSKNLDELWMVFAYVDDRPCPCFKSPVSPSRVCVWCSSSVLPLGWLWVWVLISCGYILMGFGCGCVYIILELNPCSLSSILVIGWIWVVVSAVCDFGFDVSCVGCVLAKLMLFSRLIKHSFVRLTG